MNIDLTDVSNMRCTHKRKNKVHSRTGAAGGARKSRTSMITKNPTETGNQQKSTKNKKSKGTNGSMKSKLKALFKGFVVRKYIHKERSSKGLITNTGNGDANVPHREQERRATEFIFSIPQQALYMSTSTTLSLDECGSNLLHLACFHGTAHDAILMYIFDNCRHETQQYLLTNTDRDGNLPSHILVSSICRQKIDLVDGLKTLKVRTTTSQFAP